MKKLTILLLCAVFVGQLFAQNADSLFIREHYTKMEVQIPMRDGARLFTSIYLPKDQSRSYPILLKRTPYSCAPYGPNNYAINFQNMSLARSGYIFVFQDVRGRYMSEGDFVDVRPFNPNKKSPGEVDEASDTYDSADWLVKNLPRNNGRIGVYGISYPGFYATMTILAGHPAIRAVSPQAPVTDWFIGDDFHHQGAFMLMDAFSFYSGFGKPRPKPTTEHAQGFSNWGTPDNYDFYLRTGALSNFTERLGMKNIPFWNDLMAHPNLDDFWKARNPRPHLRGIQPAVLTVGGLFDAEDCFGAWALYKAIEKQNPASHANRIVMGPWVHGGWARTTGDRLGNVVFGSKTSDYYQKYIETPFFEHHLKDAPDPKLADATIFETGSNSWTSYDAWPPKLAAPTKFYFDAEGRLAAEAAPTTPPIADRYLSDPAKPVPYTEDVHLNRTREYMCDDQRFAARRPDVLLWQTEALRKPLTLAGPLTADLLVSLVPAFGAAAPSGLLDADFVVKLIDVFPDTLRGSENGVPLGGYQMLVRGEIFRGRYRDSYENPAGFRSGEKARVKFDLPDVAHTFLPGHKIMVQVQSSWFPLADRNPQQFINIYQAKDTDFVPVQVEIWLGGADGSGIILPVLRN